MPNFKIIGGGQWKTWSHLTWNDPIDSGVDVSDIVVVRNCCVARMLPGEAEFVSK